MRRSLITCSGFFFATSLLAQGFMTTPPGGLKGEGASFNYALGGWPNMRAQLIDDMHTDGQVKALVDISFRLDYRNHYPATAMGRTWSNITVAMAELPASHMTMYFANNLGNSSTRVFDSKWSWPTQTGVPLRRPDVWAGIKGQLRFPFIKPWVYSGKYAIVSDYTFQGGVLANNATWNTITVPGFFLDGEQNLPTVVGAGMEQLPAVLPQCNDSAVTDVYGAFTKAAASANGKHYLPPQFAGKLGWEVWSTRTAPNEPVMYALGAGGISNGVDIGAACNRLYVDLSKPVVLMSFTANAYGYATTGIRHVDWQNDFASLALWAQGAWADSSTKAFKLTSAMAVSLPRGLPSEIPLRYWFNFYTNLTSKHGFGIPSNTHFPYIGYRLQ